MAAPRTRKALIVGAVVVVALIAGGVIWYVSRDSPDEVDLDTAAEQVRERSTTTAGPGEDTAADGVEGTWTVDTETGEFDYESATGSFVGFRVEEELANIGAATAVGRTGEITGAMTIEGATVPEASFEVDMTSITTDEPRRDSRVQEALHTDQHPTATFRLTEPIELGDATSSGQITADATGELTVNGVTKPITLAIEAELVQDTIVVVGSTEVVFSDFDVEVPSAPIVVSAEDRGTLELQLLFTRSE
jgi:polyisoprenoid-binding protein YceI